MMEKKESAIDAFMRKTMLGHIGDIEAANTKLSDAEARIAEITKWRDEWKDMATEFKGLVEEWQARAEAAEALLNEAFLRGFMSSAEGYNGEYPFDLDEDCLNSQKWVEMRDRVLSALKEKP